MSDIRKRKVSRRNGSSPRVRVSFACNDPDNGLFDGQVSMFSVDAGQNISIDLDGGEARLTVGDDWLRFMRQKVKILGGKDWVGNWCWNAYTLSLDDATRLLHAAVASGKYSTTGANGDSACDLSDALDRKPPLEAIRAGLAAMVVEARQSP